MEKSNQPVVITGNVGKDPEQSFTPSGKPVTHLSLAVHAGKDKDGKTLTSWFRVTFWGELNQKVTDTVKSGDRLVIGGQLTPTPRVFDNKAGETVGSYDLVGFYCEKIVREYKTEALS